MAPRIKASVRDVQSASRKSIWIVFWIFVVHFAAIAEFSRGFLLTRPVLLEKSEKPYVKEPPFDRAVILVVDALRYDFVETPIDAGDAPFLRHFPVGQISDDPRNSFTAKFLADPPTTTLQRLKGLTTGSLPAFIDAGANFAGFKIEEDNWVTQAAEKLGPVSFVGDDTWEALYSHAFSLNYPYPSLNVRDLDTVDNGVKQYLPSLIQNTSNKIVIGHMLGVDHVGHRFGPSHPVMSKKLDETFSFVREVAGLIDDRTVLLVMGDHGMDQTGNHGGDSPDELEAALWAYSKRPVFSSEGDATVRQIDFVPTISGLLGTPIPFNSLGFPIRQAFDAKTWELITQETKHQIQVYTEAVDLQQARSEAERSQELPPKEFQQAMLSVFSDAWIQFNEPDMFRGIGLLGASVIVTLVLYNSVAGNDPSDVATYQSYGAAVGTIAGAALCWGDLSVSRIHFLISALFYVSVGVLISAIFAALKAPNFSIASGWSLGAFVLLTLECCQSFSNSFVIWEPRILQFLIATAFVLLAAKCAKTGSPIVTYLGGFYCAVLLLVVRMCSSWVVCREETSTQCSTTFFEPGSSLVASWTLFAIGLLGLFLPHLLRRFWAIGKNDVGTASLMLNMTPLALVFVAAYWSLENAEARGWLSHELFGIQTIKILLARLSLAFGIVGGLIIWWRSDVPIEIVFKNKRPERIEGYTNIHGAYALIVAVCLFWSFSVTNKPPGILSLAGLLYSSICLLDLIDVSNTKYTWMVPVLFDLLSNAFFFYTGHQATIPSIQWDAAFIAARSVSFPWSQLTVFLNTFGSFILGGVVCVFSAFWRRPPFKNPKQPVAFALRAAIGLSTVCSIRALFSVLAACNLRRHLMSWKVFAPRFMFGALSLLVTDIACIIGLIFSGHTIKKVTEMFGYN